MTRCKTNTCKQSCVGRRIYHVTYCDTLAMTLSHVVLVRSRSSSPDCGGWQGTGSDWHSIHMTLGGSPDRDIHMTFGGNTGLETSTDPGCHRTMDPDMTPVWKHGPQTSTWFQLSSQTIYIHIVSGGNLGHVQHRLQLQENHRPRCGSQWQLGPGHHRGLRCQQRPCSDRDPLPCQYGL